jgi:hypothetical protein
MPSASGLNQAQRLRARERATQAAMLALHHKGKKGPSQVQPEGGAPLGGHREAPQLS